MTSLVLGPPAARQLQLSLSIPLIEPADRAATPASNATVVIGAHVAPSPRPPIDEEPD
jgi:hypothetical protein